MIQRFRITPVSIAVIYLVMSIAWIIVTDVVLVQLAPQLEEYQHWQTMKGLLFVGLSALILYFLVNKHSKQIKRSEYRLEVAERMANLGHWVRYLDTDRFEFSEYLLKLLGLPANSSLNYEEILELIHPEDRDKLTKAAENMIQTGTSYNMDVRVLTKSRETEYGNFRLQAEAFKDEQGNVVEIHGTALDITSQVNKEKQLEQSIEEKNILIQEIHHRVKNNLAIISGLLQLQIFNSNDDKLHAILEDSLMRIYSIALVHERLYKSPDFANISNQDYLVDLIDRIEKTFHDSVTDITIEQQIKDVEININQAVPCAMLVNELIINAYRHAFDNRSSGWISIEMEQKGKTIHLKVRDNGIGLPEGFSLDRTSSLGSKLLQLLTRQLHGEIDYTSNPGEGTVFHVAFEKSDRIGSSSSLQQ